MQPDNSGSLRGEVQRAVKAHEPDGVVVTEPGEWRLKDDMTTWAEDLGCNVDIREDDRFICSHKTFETWAQDRKQLRMEYFYREMRKATGLLMDGDDPEGGKWNFDADNRKPAKPDLFMPEPHRVDPDEITKHVLELVASKFHRPFRRP